LELVRRQTDELENLCKRGAELMRYKNRFRRSIAMIAATAFLSLQMGIASAGGGFETRTTTPIKHLVVIFQENISFDHYFGTYPNATNPAGEPVFQAAKGTPPVNGLSNGLLTSNPNSLNASNLAGASNPFRLDRSQAATADQDHNYLPEQLAFDHGLMDLFPMSVGTAGPPPSAPPDAVTTTGLTMGYYDGNTVTAFWNYAQRFAMSDNSFGTTFGPSTPGALNLIAGQTNGAVAAMGSNVSSVTVPNTDNSLTLIGDADPTGDMCSTSSKQVSMSGVNIGDLLSKSSVTWGWFEGGFDLSGTNENGTMGCSRTTTSDVTGVTEVDYIPHHAPFQYYASTANLDHKRPTSLAAIGTNKDAANHEYDTNDFFEAVATGNFPSVSFLKAPGFQDGHAGYSDPLDEQNFVVSVINFLQKQPDWRSTAVVISYDDSDGWYDHQLGPILNQSTSSFDGLTGSDQCGTGDAALPGVNPALAHAQGRCGYGPRLPLLVISPFSRVNFVDHTPTSQTSIIRFIEDNWLNSKRIGQGSFDALTNSITGMFDFAHPNHDALFLDPTTGEQGRGHHGF
jgi:phospholipase C